MRNLFVKTIVKLSFLCLNSTGSLASKTSILY
jgi:hypothetical protein